MEEFGRLHFDRDSRTLQGALCVHFTQAFVRYGDLSERVALHSRALNHPSLPLVTSSGDGRSDPIAVGLQIRVRCRRSEDWLATTFQRDASILVVGGGDGYYMNLESAPRGYWRSFVTVIYLASGERRSRVRKRQETRYHAQLSIPRCRRCSCFLTPVGTISVGWSLRQSTDST